MAGRLIGSYDQLAWHDHRDRNEAAVRQNVCLHTLDQRAHGAASGLVNIHVRRGVVGCNVIQFLYELQRHIAVEIK